MTHHLVMNIAYDGSSYFGWQETKEGPSIERALKRVLEQIFSEKISLRAASRTDRGVHANNQVVDFFCSHLPKDLSKLEISVNQLLPPDIRCFSLFFAPSPSFHPTLSASSKVYRYYISPTPVQKPHLRNTHWHIYAKLNVGLMREALSLFIGEHDFRAFCNMRPDLPDDFLRIIYSIDLSETNHELIFEIHGKSFLYKMVRNIVGSIIYVGQKKLSLSSIKEAFSSRMRACAGITAPAHGLTLWKVYYPE